MFTPENLPNLLKEVEKFKEGLAQQNLPNIWQELDKCQKAVQEAQGSLTNPQQKKILGDALGESIKARKQLETSLPELLADLEKRQKESIATIHDLAGKIEQAEQNFEAQLKAEAELMKAPTVPELNVDPNHGAELAQELLGLLGMLEKVTGKGFDDAGSIARMWSETEAAEHGDAVTAPAKSPPPPAPSAPATPAAKTDRPTLKPRSSKPLSRPRRDVKPQETEPTHDESIGRTPFEDE